MEASGWDGFYREAKNILGAQRALNLNVHIIRSGLQLLIDRETPLSIGVRTTLVKGGPAIDLYAETGKILGIWLPQPSNIGDLEARFDGVVVPVPTYDSGVKNPESLDTVPVKITYNP